MRRICRLIQMLLIVAGGAGWGADGAAADGSGAATTASADAETTPALEWITSFGGHVDGWVRQGDALYLMQGSMIRTIDLSDPERPVERDALDIGHIITGFELNPPALYLATTEFGDHLGGFEMIDLSDPWRPVRSIHSIRMDRGKTTRLTYKGHFLWGDGVYDVRDPLNPVLLEYEQYPDFESLPAAVLPAGFQRSKGYSDPHPAAIAPPAVLEWARLEGISALAVTGNNVLVASGEGFLVVDVSDPSRPEMAGKAVLPSGGLAIETQDNLALVSDRERRLSIFDVSDPSSPTLRSRIVLPGRAIHIDCASTIAAAVTTAAESRGVQFLDITQADEPRLAGFYPAECEGVVLRGNLAYLATDRLEVVDISDPWNPRQVGVSETPEETNVHLDSHWVMDTGEEPEEEVNPFAPSGRLNLMNDELFAVGPMVFHEPKDYTYGFINIFDVSDPTRPRWSRALEDGQYWDVRTQDDLICFFTRSSSTAHHSHDLQICRRSGARFETLGWTNKFLDPYDIAVDGDMVYVADAELGLVILRCDRDAKALPERP